MKILDFTKAVKQPQNISKQKIKMITSRKDK